MRNYTVDERLLSHQIRCSDDDRMPNWLFKLPQAILVCIIPAHRFFVCRESNGLIFLLFCQQIEA